MRYKAGTKATPPKTFNHTGNNGDHPNLFASNGMIRESRYPMFLRRKNATRGSGVDRKAEMASIGKSRGSLIDPRTEQSQVAIEAAISEGTQFDSHGGGILHDAA